MGAEIPRPPGDLVHPEPPADAISVRAFRIVDGDSLEAELGEVSAELRLEGINAPEADECFFNEASDSLQTSMGGDDVVVEIAGDDQFGRHLANLWVDGELINLTLVADGLAIALTPGEDATHGSLLLAAEEDAYEQRKGLWAPDACGPGGPLPEISIDLGRSQTNPPGRDEVNLGQEYVVIVNEGDQAYELSGWTLRDESSRNRLIFDAGLIIGAGESLSVSSGCNRLPSWCGNAPIWNNAGDLVLLLDASGRVVARARY